MPFADHMVIAELASACPVSLAALAALFSLPLANENHRSHPCQVMRFHNGLKELDGCRQEP